jgi:hypothetical protein
MTDTVLDIRNNEPTDTETPSGRIYILTCHPVENTAVGPFLLRLAAESFLDAHVHDDDATIVYRPPSDEFRLLTPEQYVVDSDPERQDEFESRFG